MITTFKIFNTKTKEVKEYSKPNFGDYGEYILIKADDLDTLAFNVEHTASFSEEKKETTEKLKTLAMAISVAYNKNQFFKNSDHELNTLHNGLFKDCIYTNGDWVGVLQKRFEYWGKVYKVGDVYDIHRKKYDENHVLIEYTSEYIIALTSGDSGDKFYGIPIKGDDYTIDMSTIQQCATYRNFCRYNYRCNVIDEYFTK